MQPSDRDPFRRNSAAPDYPPHSRWKDALLIGAFVLFVYIFVMTGGFIPKPQPTPTFSLAPTPIARLLHTITPVPTKILLTPTPTEITPKLANQSPDIRGTVIRIYLLNGTVTGAYVRGRLAADTSVAQAFIRFSDNTYVFIRKGDQYQRASLLDLTKGDSVEILFEAPIEQASPQPSIAEEIVIVK